MSSERMQDRVNDICNELYGKGEKVSVRIILTYLSDVSSTSTVHKYYANWRNELEANEKSLYDKLGFSSEFTQMFMKEISRFSVEAEQRYKGISEEANEQRDTAIDELARVEERLYKQNAVLEQQAKDITQLKSEAITKDNAHVAEREKRQDSHEVLVAELRLRIEQLENEVSHSVATNESLRTELAKSEVKLDNNQDYVNEVKTKHTQLESINAELQTGGQALSTQVTKLSTQLEGANTLVSMLEKRVNDFEKQTATLQTKATEAEANYKLTSTELVETKSLIHHQAQQIGSLEEMNVQQKRYIAKIENNSTQ